MSTSTCLIQVLKPSRLLERSSRYVHSLTLTLLAALTVGASDPRPQATPAPFADEIAAFERLDARQTPEPGGIVFVGSSSIRLWKTLAADFPGYPVINRGFGGSQIADSIRYAHQIVTPYRPRMIVMFAGTNDIASGKTGDQVAADFKEFTQVVRQRLPKVRIAYIAISPAPSRWDKVDAMRRANRLVQKFCTEQPDMAFINTFEMMLDDSGQPRPELYVSDRLHLNAAGYDLWRRIVRPYLDWGLAAPAP